MEEEIKKAYLSWSEKGVCYLNSMYVYDTLTEVNQALQRCDEILKRQRWESVMFPDSQT